MHVHALHVGQHVLSSDILERLCIFGAIGSCVCVCVRVCVFHLRFH